MKQEMFVIATRGRQGKEVYLAYDNERSSKSLTKCYMKWTEDIDEAMATFTYTDAEECAKKHFKNFNKWYIKPFMATFS